MDRGCWPNRLGQAVKLRRADVVVAVFPGELGKPRPAIVMQADDLIAAYSTILACPLTTHLIDAPLLRPSLEPTEDNGLRLPSQVMVEKITPVRKEAIAQQVGRLTEDDMTRIETALIHIIGLTSTIAPAAKQRRQGEQQ